MNYNYLRKTTKMNHCMNMAAN